MFSENLWDNGLAPKSRKRASPTTVLARTASTSSICARFTCKSHSVLRWFLGVRIFRDLPSFNIAPRNFPPVSSVSQSSSKNNLKAHQFGIPWQTSAPFLVLNPTSEAMFVLFRRYSKRLQDAGFGILQGVRISISLQVRGRSITVTTIHA